MELSFQQLLFLIIAAIVLVMGVLRGRLPTESDRTVGNDGNDDETPPPFPSSRRPRPTAQQPPPAPPPRLVQPRPTAVQPLPPSPKPAQQTQSPTKPVAAAEPYAPVARRPTTAPSPRPRPWPAEVLRRPDGLHRSVVLMTLLGPPRSIEPPP